MEVPLKFREKLDATLCIAVEQSLKDDIEKLKAGTVVTTDLIRRAIRRDVDAALRQLGDLRKEQAK